MLVNRLWWWPSIKPTLNQRLVFAGPIPSLRRSAAIIYATLCDYKWIAAWQITVFTISLFYLCNIDPLDLKYKSLNQCWGNLGSFLAQQWTNIETMPRVFRVNCNGQSVWKPCASYIWREDFSEMGQFLSYIDLLYCLIYTLKTLLYNLTSTITLFSLTCICCCLLQDLRRWSNIVQMSYKWVFCVLGIYCRPIL